MKNYTLLKKGELAYNHGYSKTRNYGSCFDLRIEEARIPFVYHAFSVPNDDSIFYGYYLNSGIFDSALKKMVSSTARMDGLLNISFEDYMSLQICRPSKEEQDVYKRQVHGRALIAIRHKCGFALRLFDVSRQEFIKAGLAEEFLHGGNAEQLFLIRVKACFLDRVNDGGLITVSAVGASFDELEA